MDLAPLYSLCYVFILLVFFAVILLIIYVFVSAIRMLIEWSRCSAAKSKRVDTIKTKKLIGLVLSCVGAAVLLSIPDLFRLFNGIFAGLPSEIIAMAERLIYSCCALLIVYGMVRILLYRVELYNDAIIIFDGMKLRMISVEDLEYVHWGRQKCTIISRKARPASLSKALYKDMQVKLRNYQKMLDIPDLRPDFYNV